MAPSFIQSIEYDRMRRVECNFNKAVANVRDAALDARPIAGLTHNYYRYPARFSPTFARAAIMAFSEPGQVVLDPYMGGGTTVIEAMVAGRRAIGSDINSLAVFVARAKTDRLAPRERHAVALWASEIVPGLRCTEPASDVERIGPRNMMSPKVRYLKKLIALLIRSLEDELPTAKAKRFARCIVLNVGQWALNGRRTTPTVRQFRERVSSVAVELLTGTTKLARALNDSSLPGQRPVLRELDAELIHMDRTVLASGPVDLVVTSPPYPGIHMLYHRWQVDGRKETDAPYWIAAKSDGCGSSFYNFADRRPSVEARYFDKAVRSFGAVRKVMRSGAIMVQLIAFADPERQLQQYLAAMRSAGFAEIEDSEQQRTWRHVPGRRWHASYKGTLSSSREVLLLHEAI